MWLKDALKSLTRPERQPVPGELGYYMTIEIIEQNGSKGTMGTVHIDTSKAATLVTPQGDLIRLTFEGA